MGDTRSIFLIGFPSTVSVLLQTVIASVLQFKKFVVLWGEKKIVCLSSSCCFIFGDSERHFVIKP